MTDPNPKCWYYYYSTRTIRTDITNKSPLRFLIVEQTVLDSLEKNCKCVGRHLLLRQQVCDWNHGSTSLQSNAIYVVFVHHRNLLTENMKTGFLAVMQIDYVKVIGSIAITKIQNWITQNMSFCFRFQTPTSLPLCKMVRTLKLIAVIKRKMVKKIKTMFGKGKRIIL